MDADDMFEVFGDFDPAEYEREARKGLAAYQRAAMQTCAASRRRPGG